jgi:predicted ATPase
MIELRLVSLQVHGFRRLLDVKVNLAGKIIAVVGPNESGKTTLLEVLARIGSSDPVPRAALSRTARPSDPETVYVEADYVLDQADQAALADLDLVEPPVRMSYSRRIKGELPMIGLEPRPRRRRDRVEQACDVLGTISADNVVSAMDSIAKDDAQGAAERSPLSERYREVLEQLGDQARDNDEDLTLRADEVISELSSADFETIASELRDIVYWRRLADVAAEARGRLHLRAPNFLLFGDSDRSLLSEYDIQGDVAANPPQAFKSLARLAHLDLVELLTAINAADHGHVVTLQNRANRQLAAHFQRSWRQSIVTVELNIQGTVVKILIKENDDVVTSFDERSAGLRMFVALAAFVATERTTISPVLLIDEAESHLHYDAQADLVSVLLTQQEAAQVIYTTHSPGCLPPDLGTGVRAVVPSRSDASVSEISNSFWTSGTAGFSPLLLAMGAGAAAFSASRYAVIAEGASEMILMPSLIRAATELEVLLYQVAPGLAEAPTSQYPDLDLQAARVAFSVDGDAGGLRLRDRLVQAGVASERIAVLNGMTLEDAVDLDAYHAAVCAEARAANRFDIAEIPVSELSAPRAVAVRAWYEQAGLVAPSKIAIANRLVQDDHAIPSEAGSAALKDLHKQFTTILGI